MDEAALIDPFAQPTLANPYPMHEVLRERAPATYLPQYGVWAVARHAEVHDHDIVVERNRFLETQVAQAERLPEAQ